MRFLRNLLILSLIGLSLAVDENSNHHGVALGEDPSGSLSKENSVSEANNREVRAIRNDLDASLSPQGLSDESTLTSKPQDKLREDEDGVLATNTVDLGPHEDDDDEKEESHDKTNGEKQARNVVRRDPDNWNTVPGIVSPQYDSSPVYSQNLSTREVYDVQNIYSKYLKTTPVSQECYRKPMGQLNEKILTEAFAYATKLVDDGIKSALDDLVNGHVLFSSVISSEGRHRITGKLPSQLSDFIDQEEALLLEFVALRLQQTLCIPPIAFVDYISKIPISHIRSRYFTCSRKHGNFGGTGLPCRNSRYRSFDGSCNNLNNPFWGKSSVCHLRFLPPAYHDGISAPRKLGYNGEPLPSPRHISKMAHSSMEGDSYYNLFHFVWGQYMIHDIVSTPQAVSDHSEGIKCCPPRDSDVSKCLPITLDPGDEQYSIRNCINFIRSAPCPLCSIGPRQQVNLATSYLDQSVMYGTDGKSAQGLRTGQRGFLKYGFDAKRQPILPNSDAGPGDQCSKPGANHQCFKSGDLRVNQHPGLQLIHMLFLRRHNYHAWNLYLVNPSASDETLFQEARRLTIAEAQHITYNEYLPIVLGPELMSYYKLYSDKELFSVYDPTVDATTWNEFVTAAGRFGHSQIKSYTKVFGSKALGMHLRDSFFDPTMLHEGVSDGLIKGLLGGRSSVIDPYLTEDVKNYLYLHRGKDKMGGDLASFNIQRGRDHGIPPYYVFVEFCFNYKIKSWADLGRFIPSNHKAKLQSIYGDWRNIDLFTGGLAERKAIDADLGPTFACLVGIQYHHLKYGDRYFYSHYGQAGSFTREQLVDMKSKFSLANFLCQTATNLDYVQAKAFLPETLTGNPKVFCNQSKVEKRLNYNLWQGLQ